MLLDHVNGLTAEENERQTQVMAETWALLGCSRAAAFAIFAYDGIEPIDIGANLRRAVDGKRLAPSLRFFVVSKSGGELAMANGLRLVADHDFRKLSPATSHGSRRTRLASGIRRSGNSRVHRHISPTRRHRRGRVHRRHDPQRGGIARRPHRDTKREIVEGETRPLDLLARHPGVRAVEARVVDTGSVLTGGGVSLGIDMTLHLVARTLGQTIAEETARILEYRHAWKANSAALPDLVEVEDAGRGALTAVLGPAIAAEFAFH